MDKTILVDVVYYTLCKEVVEGIMFLTCLSVRFIFCSTMMIFTELKDLELSKIRRNYSFLNFPKCWQILTRFLVYMFTVISYGSSSCFISLQRFLSKLRALKFIHFKLNWDSQCELLPLLYVCLLLWLNCCTL